MRRVVAVLAVFVALVCIPASDAAASAAPNSGLDGSTCAPMLWGEGSYPGLAPGLSTTALGTDAPAYYELGQPSGAFAGQRPKGTMLVIHGGGWYRIGKNIVAAVRSRADRWRAAGWVTVNIDYRACAQSFGDVLWFMERIRMLTPRRVVCATGDSAGGHLALLLASVRSDLSCVMAYGAASDLVSIRGQLAYDPRTGLEQNSGPKYVSNVASAAFGGTTRALVGWSPVRHARKVTARLLLASSAFDPLIPAEQNVAYAEAIKAARPLAQVEVVLLEGGRTPFVHAGVSDAAMADLTMRENALVSLL